MRGANGASKGVNRQSVGGGEADMAHEVGKATDTITAHFADAAVAVEVDKAGIVASEGRGQGDNEAIGT
jgi:hypothetical protein